MRWIGYFLLCILFLLIILAFVKIRIQVVVKEQQQFVELRYLWFKYRYHFSQLWTDEMKEEVKHQVENATDKVAEKVVETEVEEDIVLAQETIEMDSSPPETKRRKKIKTKRPVKKKKVKKKLAIHHIKVMYRKFKMISKQAKKVLIRFTRRVKIHELESLIEFNVDDLMLNGCLVGALWTIQANVFAFISRYVRVMEHYHFDVVSQFSGNRIFMELSCIVSIRIVDIIIVLLSSFKELMTIYKTIRLEEDL